MFNSKLSRRLSYRSNCAAVCFFYIFMVCNVRIVDAAALYIVLTDEEVSKPKLKNSDIQDRVYVVRQFVFDDDNDAILNERVLSEFLQNSDVREAKYLILDWEGLQMRKFRKAEMMKQSGIVDQSTGKKSKASMFYESVSSFKQILAISGGYALESKIGLYGIPPRGFKLQDYSGPSSVIALGELVEQLHVLVPSLYLSNSESGHNDRHILKFLKDVVILGCSAKKTDSSVCKSPMASC